MEEHHMYQQIAESIRREILEGSLKAGDGLPSIRNMTKKWNCTPGTVHRAYKELANQRLVVSHVGQGTHITGNLDQREKPLLQKAILVNKAENFLLEILTLGYSLPEVEDAFHIALDRWKNMKNDKPPVREFDFVGSHDLAFNQIVSHFNHDFPQYEIKVNYAGSLGGLIALAEGKALFAGCHLWDAESDSYNQPYIRRLLPGRKIALINLAHRRIGLLFQPGNPFELSSLNDLTNPNVKFVNRQRGSGTRVWLDAQLSHLHITPSDISGYEDEKRTHTEVAQTIAKGVANVGIGLEASAIEYGLGFKFQTLEKYDLVVPEENMNLPQVQKFLRNILAGSIKDDIVRIGGYDITGSGEVIYVDF